MAEGPAGVEVHRGMATLFAAGMVGDLSDAQLVSRYLGGRDESARAAFAALVDRHGPMVLRACRQALRGNAHDAQDAFQATFLILARKAGSVRHRESVAGWLHGVALRVAARARSAADRRRLRERSAASRIEANPAPSEPVPELHEELARLPARFREPIVLCYLEGLSTEAAALRLGCPRGTILSRLSRGRDRLRQRLARRGLDPSVVAVAASRIPDAALPARIIEATARLSIGFARGRAVDLSLVSGSSLTLAQGMLHAMNLTKLFFLAAATLAGAVTLQGTRSLAFQDGRTEAGPAGQSKGDAEAARPLDDQPTAPGPAKLDPPRLPAEDVLPQQIVKLQAELAESNRNQAAMLEELRALRAQMQKLEEAGRSAPARSAPPRPGANGREFMMMGGIGGGMARGRGGRGFGGGNPDGSDTPIYTRIGNGSRIVVTSAKEGKAILYNAETGERHALEVADEKDGAAVEVIPVVGPGLVALQVAGPKIRRIAAALPDDGGWYVQDLREPLDGTAAPIVGPGIAAYSIGSRVYAFSAKAKRWDVAELAEGSMAVPIVGPGSVTLTEPGHVWTLDGESGKWSHLDLNAILKGPAPARP
ncbi:sigma-70 family RNA polymerase sigma factor [Tundrisphaera sp. TA3]|uniref:sigma-70 family RNA polymerase sigma factor n=1 Tax=Tundrisphaera sp. TA3 TaxID=3435775 RepID=UPI003EBB005D